MGSLRIELIQNKDIIRAALYSRNGLLALVKFWLSPNTSFTEKEYLIIFDDPISKFRYWRRSIDPLLHKQESAPAKILNLGECIDNS